MTEDQIWGDREFTGRDFRDEDLSRIRTERVVFDGATAVVVRALISSSIDLRRMEPSRSSASCTRRWMSIVIWTTSNEHQVT